MARERRDWTTSITLETRDGDKPVISGYAAVFYREGDAATEYELWPGMVERIAQGAFGDFGDVIAPFNHDPSQLLGRLSSGTLRLRVDEKGLRYEIDPPNTSLAKDVLELMRRGDVNGSSFAFEAVEAPITRDGQKQVRTLKRVTLYDVGPVVNPAYKGTSAAVRCEGIETIRDEFAKLQQMALARRSKMRGYEITRRKLLTNADK